jgi:hypothetical protein
VFYVENLGFHIRIDVNVGDFVHGDMKRANHLVIQLIEMVGGN